MRVSRTFFLLFSITFLSIVALTTFAAAQDDDSPSLGDVARKARLQKQKDAQGQAKDASVNAAQSKDTQPTTTAKDSASTQNQKDASSKASADKDASAKDPLAKGSKKVITNDEIPEHVGPTSTLPLVVKVPGAQDPLPNYADGKIPPQYLKNQFQQMKQYISSLESSIQDLTDSMRYAGGSCAVDCARWNAMQQQKQQQVENMTAQLTQQQKALEAAQEAARKQGYSSAVYDP